MEESEDVVAALNTARRKLSGSVEPTPPRGRRRLPSSPSMRLKMLLAEQGVGPALPPAPAAGTRSPLTERRTPIAPAFAVTIAEEPTPRPASAEAAPPARRPSIADAMAASHGRHVGRDTFYARIEQLPAPSTAARPSSAPPPPDRPASAQAAAPPPTATPEARPEPTRKAMSQHAKKKGPPKADSWWVDEAARKHVVKYWGEFGPELLMQGLGEFGYDGGDKYIGTWKDGKKHGKGSLYYGDGYSYYVGEWVDGFQHGRGRFVYGDAAIDNEDEHCKKYHNYAKTGGSCGGGEYEGQWIAGKKCGHGILRWGAFSPDFAGPLANDYSPESLVLRHARKRYAFGARKSQMEISRNYYVYVGNWEDDERHGRGVYTDIEGNSYEGVWRKGLLHGRGIWRGAFGDSYEGDFVNNQRQGRGRYVNVDGSIYDGPWWADKRHGTARYTFADGVTVEAYFENDKQVKFGRLVFAPADSRLFGKRTVERRAPPSEPLRLVGDIESVLRGWWLAWSRRAAAGVKAGGRRHAHSHGHGH